MQINFRFQKRQNEFQNNMTEEHLALRREKFAVELRKNKRSQKIQKRRNSYSVLKENASFPRKLIPQELVQLEPSLADPKVSDANKYLAVFVLLKNTPSIQTATMCIQTLSKVIVSESSSDILLSLNAHKLLNNFACSKEKALQVLAVDCMMNIAEQSQQACKTLLLEGCVDSIIEFGNPDQRKSCLRTLGCFADYENINIDVVLQAGIHKRVLNSYLNLESPLLEVAIRLIGNICSGSDSQTQEVLDLNLCDTLASVCECPKPRVRRILYWTLSNIAAGTPSQVKYLIKHPVFERALQGLKDSNQGVRIEVSTILGNISRVLEDDEKILGKLDKHLQEVKAGLEDRNPEVLIQVLKFCKKLLSHGRYESDQIQVLENAMLEKLQDSGVMEAIASLLQFPNSKVSQKAAGILDEFQLEDQDLELLDPVNEFEFS